MVDAGEEAVVSEEGGQVSYVAWITAIIALVLAETAIISLDELRDATAPQTGCYAQGLDLVRCPTPTVISEVK